MLVVVLSFERCPIRFCGSYGAEFSHTPSLDSLATEARVFDHCRAAGIDQSALEALFRGRITADDRPPLETDVWDELAAQGVQIEVLAEAPEGQPPAATPRPDHTVWTDGLDGADVQDFETPIAQLIAEARRRIEAYADQPDQDRLLWIQSRGIPLPWVPPNGYLQFEDEADEEAADEEAELESSGAVRAEQHDRGGDDQHDIDEQSDRQLDAGAPGEQTSAESLEDSEADSEPELTDDREIDNYQDWVFSAGRLGDAGGLQLDEADWDICLAGYAGYVRLLDQFSGWLFECITDFAGPVRWIVTAAQGQALNERLDDDLVRLELTSSRINVPLWVYDSRDQQPHRDTRLVSTTDVMASVAESFGFQVATDGVSFWPSPYDRPAAADRDEMSGHANGRSCLLVSGTEEIGLETPEFRYLQKLNRDTAAPDLAQPGPSDPSDRSTSSPPPSGRGHLFAKPDDYWDWWDVSDQEPATAESFQSWLERWQTALAGRSHLKPGDGPADPRDAVVDEGEQPTERTQQERTDD